MDRFFSSQNPYKFFSLRKLEGNTRSNNVNNGKDNGKHRGSDKNDVNIAERQSGAASTAASTKNASETSAYTTATTIANYGPGTELGYRAFKSHLEKSINQDLQKRNTLKRKAT